MLVLMIFGQFFIYKMVYNCFLKKARFFFQFSNLLLIFLHRSMISRWNKTWKNSFKLTVIKLFDYERYNYKKNCTYVN